MERARVEKEALAGLLRGGKLSVNLAIEVTDDAFEVGFVEDLFVLSGAQEEGATAEVVDLAGDALGVVVDAGDEAVAEELALEASDVKVMFDVARGFFEVEGGEVVADGNALVESFIGGEAELEGEVRLAEEDEGEEGSGVHVVVEQEAQLVKEVRREEVGLIDDQEGVAAFASQVSQGVAQLGEETAEGKGGLDLKGEEDFAVEGSDAEVGIGEIDDGVDITVQGVGKGTQGGGFSGTDVASDESGEALLKGEGEAALDFAMATGGIEVLAGDRLGEGSVAEAVEVIEGGHRSHSPWD
jgi:hypothetical protein